eukprot:scaffold97591_cov19-Tisochrysis_lutea.AAC.1
MKLKSACMGVVRSKARVTKNCLTWRSALLHLDPGQGPTAFALVLCACISAFTATKPQDHTATHFASDHFHCSD